ncbi:ATP-binding cassette domain-containing protein [Mesomycoplasma ovipneumoniae]|uniref:ATP-binding cassette domain-containing protein n=1 Tax=Mesomycoplasma ovipneumoniae TaxID=29562 RepID=A0AAJ2P5R9_9BACT|nr:ATP-binding cassette domain-containing protein [Mesomycoplasma ovipneumoniae]MDW2829804.1 ATP-binding cassette domain-containing protein [Mesomycoplasma ovipneumoniae]MDW2835655.1 ATP-binding cassette domain-containing protein [Mesomycoplasma ovipneumoniae]MDW2852407.1 ATP-binding cassette domain-containing protein [Mesomycoplasma ovipneumoniae]MDW2861862.1 ATP-binding cassette domain-containing protein [Mesomycoplasma ovipneumoniae]MDW2870939.1 ATP-binding cassette domain-containing protei
MKKTDDNKKNEQNNFEAEIKKIRQAANSRYKSKFSIPAIEIKDLTIDFGETLAVDSANIKIYKGELVTLLGPSGSGKTTILNAIAGLLNPTSGQIIFNGDDVTRKSPQQRKIGLVFQNYALYPHLNVFGNIAFALHNDPRWKQKAIEKSMLARVNANSIVLAKNGASLEDLEIYKNKLFDYFDIYRQLEHDYNELKAQIYHNLNQLQTDYFLIEAHKQAEIKNLTIDFLKLGKSASIFWAFWKRVFGKKEGEICPIQQAITFRKAYKLKVDKIKKQAKLDKKAHKNKIQEEKYAIKNAPELVRSRQNFLEQKALLYEKLEKLEKLQAQFLSNSKIELAKIQQGYKNFTSKTSLKDAESIKLDYEEQIEAFNQRKKEKELWFKTEIENEKNQIKNSGKLANLEQTYLETKKKFLETNTRHSPNLLLLKSLKTKSKTYKKETLKLFLDYERNLINKFSLNTSKLSEQELQQYQEYQNDNISIKEAINRAVLRTAEKVEITKNLAKKPTKLSGGQQQRVAIARGIVRHPDILLMDEPLSNLDAKLRVQTRQWIRRIQTEIGITTVFVTHDQEEAMSISDRIICMSTGYVQQIGTPTELYHNPKNEFVASFLGVPEMNIFDAFYDKETKSVIVDNQIIFELLKDYEHEKIRVGIRAEDLVENEAGNFQGKISVIEYLGKDILAKIDVENIGQISIILRKKPAYEIDEIVKFSIKSGKLHLFDYQTRERIQWT